MVGSEVGFEVEDRQPPSGVGRGGDPFCFGDFGVELHARDEVVFLGDFGEIGAEFIVGREESGPVWVALKAEGVES